MTECTLSVYNIIYYYFDILRNGSVTSDMAGASNKYLKFRGKLFLRQDNLLCYGDMNDKYILFLCILTTKKIDTQDPNKKLETADKVLVQILSTDTSKPAHERMVKQFDKNGLYDAMEIGLIWLDKFNNAG